MNLEYIVNMTIAIVGRGGPALVERSEVAGGIGPIALRAGTKWRDPLIVLGSICALVYFIYIIHTVLIQD
jgi:hypothetical protein